MLNKKSLNLIIKIVGIVGIFSIGIVIGFFILNDTQTDNNYGNNNDPISDNDLLFLAPPITSSFLDEEAGITIYLDAGQSLDLGVAKNEFKTIEEETADYVIGSLGLPNLPETEDVHCLVHNDGWIVCFYLKQEPTSKIVDWNFYSGGILSKTKLYEGLEIIANAYPSVLITNPSYYHYNYQNANKLMIIIDESPTSDSDSFNLFLPTEFTFYEKSWNLNGQITKIGKFSGELNQGITHIINLDYTGYSAYNYILRVDGAEIDRVYRDSQSKGRVAVVLVYYQP